MKSTERGITLIALIITIVVMLILVGVSLQMALQSGLFNITGKAAGDLEGAQQNEREIADGKVRINNITYNSVGEYVESFGLNGGNIPTGERPTVALGQKASETSNYTSNGKTAVIPGGVTVSGVPSESTIDGGLVIYLINDKSAADIAAINWNDGTTVANLQKTYDQFVWIPVNDINAMYMCQDEDGTKSCNITVEAGQAKCTTHNSTQMAGRLYATTTGENFNGTLDKQTYTTSDLREPDVLTNNEGAYLSSLTNILGMGYDTIDSFKQSLQNEYNDIVKSVYENKGFYVGRYETSNIKTTDGTAIQVRANATPSKSLGWSYMYAQQKDYVNNKETEGVLDTNIVGSTMIQGAAYDQVMKFVADGTQYSITTSRNDLHGLTEPILTGTPIFKGSTIISDCVKNIWDLEGNVVVLTTEVHNNFPRSRVYRGGSYNDNHSASYREIFYDPDVQYFGNIGTLSQLYIK